ALARLGPIQEVRAREDRAQRVAHAGLEAAFPEAPFVERHQAVEVLIRHRAAERALGQIRDDVERAAPLLAGLARLADENLLAARRPAETGDRQRTADLQRVRRLDALLPALERDGTDASVALGEAAVHERDGELVLPGRRME